LNSYFEVTIAKARPMVDAETLHPNSVINIFCSWIREVAPFFMCCSKYLAWKIQSKAWDLYLEITWSF